MSIADQKEKLQNKQDSSTIYNRYQQIQEQLRQQVVQEVTTGQLMVPSIGVIWEPPLICEWIIEPLRPYLCGPEQGYPGELKLEPCYYDKSKWGWCFWDPSLTTLHIIKLMQLGLVRPELSKILGRILAGSGVADVLAIKTVFNFKAIDTVMAQKFLNDPGMVRDFQDIYKNLETVEWNGKKLYRIYIEGIGEIWFDTISNLLFGMITGVTPTGYGLLLSYGEEILDKYVWDWINDKVADSIIRFLPGYASTKVPPKTPIGYKQKLTYEVEKWGEKRALMDHVMQLVTRKLQKLGMDPVTIQKYVSAAWELMFFFYGPKGEMEDYVRKFKYNLDFDTFVKVWRNKWEGMNLRADLITEIIELVGGIWLRHLQISRLSKTAEQLLKQM